MGKKSKRKHKTLLPRKPSQINYELLRKARGDRPLSDLARRVNVSYQQLWYIERGERQPSLPLLMKLCDVYSLDPAQLLTAA